MSLFGYTPEEVRTVDSYIRAAFSMYRRHNEILTSEIGAADMFFDAIREGRINMTSSDQWDATDFSQMPAVGAQNFISEEQAELLTNVCRQIGFDEASVAEIVRINCTHIWINADYLCLYFLDRGITSPSDICSYMAELLYHERRHCAQPTKQVLAESNAAGEAYFDASVHDSLRSEMDANNWGCVHAAYQLENRTDGDICPMYEIRENENHTFLWAFMGE